MVKKKLISKSAYLVYKQCPRYLWYYINERDSIPEPDPSTKFFFRIGHIVGQLAKSYFPDGVEVGYEDDFDRNLKKTADMLQEGRPLFEAGFLYNDKYCDLYARADVFIPAKDRENGKVYDVVEVKSSTGVKEINLYDLAFQKYCYTMAGLPIRRCSLMHINNQYVRNEEIDVRELFTVTEVTETIDKICNHIKNDLKQMVSIIYSEYPPEMEVGKFCDSPYSCPLKKLCWENVSDNNIYYLYSITKKLARRLRECGIENMVDIPDDFTGINYKQQVQIKCEKNSDIRIDKEAISDYLNKIRYPVYFLDFETFASPIPIVQNTRPYQNIPFQFSLHMLSGPGGDLKHSPFLSSGERDPRKEVIEHLKKSIGPVGSILVYNDSFEKAILRELANMFPVYADWVNSVLERVVDLYEPFRNFHYYNVKQKGSASVKRVLPVLTGKSYDNMEISNGSIASVTFLENSGLWRDYVISNELDIMEKSVLFKDKDGQEREDIRRALEQYCELDTEGMVHILLELEKIAGDSPEENKI